MRALKVTPFSILAASALVVALLILAHKKPQDRVRQNAAPLVRIALAEPTPYQFTVIAHGSVAPRTESDLIPQVSGEVLWISPSLAAGGFFESGDVLVRVDTADYRVDRETAQASVARATSEYRRSKKELGRQHSLATRSVASESRIDDAENSFHIAEASLREAEARLERADRDLARTELRAPYRGRVRSKKVDVGQFITRGAAIATLYAVDYAEIRLPVPDRDLAYLDIPLIPQAQHNDAKGDTGNQSSFSSSVVLSSEFAGREHRWEATLVRTEAELDPRSRMVRLVARVSDPYGLEGDAESGRTSPLAVGLFVRAEIEGRSVDRAFILPRDALRSNDRVYIVDAENRIRFRDVEVLRIERENVVLGAGLAKGDRVCISALEAVIDGMRVRVLDDEKNIQAEGLAERTSGVGETNEAFR